MPDVAIVGAGPVGMLLAALLHREGVSAEVVERRTAVGGGSRAIGVHAPVLAALEESGLTERLLDGAVRVGRGEARSRGRLLGTVRFDRLSTRFPFVATLPQARTEQVLADAAPTPRRGVAVTAIDPATGRVSVAEGDPIEASVVVLAGGWTSRGLAYRRTSGRDYPDAYLMADGDVPPRDRPEVAVVHLDRHGLLESFPLPDGRRRFVASDPDPRAADAADRADRLRRALSWRGEHDGAAAVGEVGAFGVRRFVAPRLRRDRLVVIGDAAHEVSPMGGQGMNLGLLDAATLAPLVVDWVRSGVAPDAGLGRWERDRVASARRSAAIATANTMLGRAAGPLVDGVRRGALRALLAPPIGGLFARAYAMGFDRAAR